MFKYKAFLSYCKWRDWTNYGSQEFISKPKEHDCIAVSSSRSKKNIILSEGSPCKSVFPPVFTNPFQWLPVTPYTAWLCDSVNVILEPANTEGLAVLNFKKWETTGRKWFWFFFQLKFDLDKQLIYIMF